MRILYSFAAILILVLIAFIGVWVLGWDSLFGIVIPYLAGILFVGGIVYRVIKWARVPVPFRIPTTSGQQKTLPWIKSSTIDNPHTTAGVIGRMVLEILLFRSLFRNERVELKASPKLIYSGSKFLWLGGLVFHWALLGILVRHTRFFLEPTPGIIVFTQNMDGILQFAIPAFYITDILILLGLTYLFVRRVIFPQVRYISLPSDYFAILLILSVAVSGVLMRHFFKTDIVGVKELAISMLAFKPVITEGINFAFYTHLFLVSTLLAYFPFSKMMHAPGIFLSPTRNLRNDNRMRRHINPWDCPVKVHTYEEYEDDFRKHMEGVGLPVDKPSPAESSE